MDEDMVDADAAAPATFESTPSVIAIDLETEPETLDASATTGVRATSIGRPQKQMRLDPSLFQRSASEPAGTASSSSSDTTKARPPSRREAAIRHGQTTSSQPKDKPASAGTKSETSAKSDSYETGSLTRYEIRQRVKTALNADPGKNQRSNQAAAMMQSAKIPMEKALFVCFCGALLRFN
jgi:hypothetical protein